MTHPAYPLQALILLKFLEQLCAKCCEPRTFKGFFDSKKETEEKIEMENIIDL